MNFAIWTMQRTGGTALAGLLASRHPAQTLHEPFSLKREFSDLRRCFSRTGVLQDEERIVRYNIKHTYELVPWHFNEALFDLLKRNNFFQILLVRRDEVARSQSRALAKLTNAYGRDAALKVYPDVVAGKVKLGPINIRHELRHLGRCLSATRQVRSMFRRHGWPEVVYEDFYAGSADHVRGRLTDLVARMSSAGVAMRDAVEPNALHARYIDCGGQHSPQLFEHVPNMRAFRMVARVRVALDKLIFMS